MPYIKQIQRKELGYRDPDNAGELNFDITDVINRYIAAKELSYQTINDIIGALECAKLELYRRVASPYEDAKMKENGDVY